MNRPDDELDNLLRDHFAGELDPMRGQARRAFEREVVTPMTLRLRQRTGRPAMARLRQATPVVLTMAACVALGFFVPQFLASPDASTAANGPRATPTQLVDLHSTVIRQEEQTILSDGLPGRRVVADRVESASFVDPQTQTRTEIFVFPIEPDAGPGRQ